MATANQYQSPVNIPAKAIVKFMELLKAKGLEQEFLDAAPNLPASLTPTGPNANLQTFERRDDILPSDIFKTLNHMSGEVGGNLDNFPRAQLTLEPGLLNYAQTFIKSHKLAAKNALAAKIQSGTCTGVDCPEGL